MHGYISLNLNSTRVMKVSWYKSNYRLFDIDHIICFHSYYHSDYASVYIPLATNSESGSTHFVFSIGN